jgi:hypothetical protein
MENSVVQENSISGIKLSYVMLCLHKHKIHQYIIPFQIKGKKEIDKNTAN